MKNIYYLITLVVLLVNLHSQAQNLTQNQKDSIVANLYSDWWVEVNRASIGVVEYNIYEAIPVLQSNIWNKDIESRVSYVEAMFGLEYEDTQYYINALFDSLQNTTYAEIDSIEMKLKLVSLLFELNDFSKIDYLIYNTLHPQGKLDNFLTIDLWNYLLNVPDYELLAKENLITLMNESTLGDNRVRALSWLGNKYKGEIAPIVINRFLEEDDFTFKWKILIEYVPLVEFGVASSFLQENLITETDETLKKQILYYLRDSLRVPANYYFVKNWLDDESSYTYMKKLAKVHERIFPGKPFTPDSTSSNEEIIDSTISYLIQSLNYGWIGDNNFVIGREYILQNAKTNLQNGDSLACREDVKAFQDSVDFVYEDSLNTDPRFVTLEGWKFLYWNAQYILDRLQKVEAIKEDE